MLRYLAFIIAVLYFSNTYATQNWKLISSENIAFKGQKDIKPSVFKAFAIDNEGFKSRFFDAPHESKVNGVLSSPVRIEIPTANGNLYTFAIVSYNLLHPDLQKSFPEIKAYYGICIEDPTITVVADYSPIYGFRAVINQPGIGKTYIDHYQRNDLNHRIVYYRKDYQKFNNMVCGVVEDKMRLENNTANRSLSTGDCLFREYRLALACTGEYATFHGGTIAGALSAMNTTMNRVNGVFAQEIAVRCVIIANNTSIMYTNGSTDPFNNTNGLVLMTQNQINTSNIIGTSNYDIGHVFSTGGGGIATMASVCSIPNSSGTEGKARGVTGTSSPIGDPFNIDYVAHEMGHQFGANHTFRGNALYCSGAGNEDTAMEPGSGSSIMAYAGICDPQNVQLNSDENYHAISLQEIKAFLSDAGSTCDIPVTGYNNSPPAITAPSNNTSYIIPISTPFALSMTASDPNGNGILYGWDQMNSDQATMPPVSTNTAGPTFRFYEPTSNPTRYFPNLTAVLAGSTAGAAFSGNNWEVLPSVTRVMNFRGVARDVNPFSGSCNSEVDVVVNTIAAAGPFAITSQNTATTWPQGSSQVVTWNVAGTTANGINCAQVDLMWTTNNGTSFTTLAAGVANDGSQNIVVPSSNTTTGRVMVKAVGNIFFDINNANITINTTSSTPTFNLALNSQYDQICQGSSKVYSVSVSSYGGFTSPVTLSVSGLPTGMTASFSSSVVTPGTTSQLTITNTSAAVNTYSLMLNGTSGTISKSADYTVISKLSASTPLLTSPTNNSTNITLQPTLSWSVSTANTYDLQISKLADFTTIDVNLTGLTSNIHTLTTSLTSYTEYFWRVRSVNDCGPSAWSTTTYKFSTQACMEYTSTNVPLTISNSAASTINSTLNITDKGTITDLDVTNLTGLHTYVDDLIFTLYAPSATNVLIWNRPCTSQDNFNITFNQSSTLANTWPCPPTNGLSYQPSTPATLNTFNGQSLKGQWRMEIQDVKSGDGGTLQTWKIKTCVNNFCRLTVDNTLSKGVGSLFAAVSCASAGDTIRFASNIVNDSIYLGTETLTINKTIFIESALSKNIHIFSNSTSPTIVSSAPNTGFGLKIKGLHIHSSLSTGVGAINNSGLLNLEDVYLYKSSTEKSTVQSNTGSTTNIYGDCRVKL